MQTPTLAILVEREEKIRKFVPRDYWEVHGDVRRARPANTPAAGSTRNSAATRKREDDDSDRAPSACGTRRAPKRSATQVHGKPGIVTEESKPTTQLSPLLYDLTSLQREANGRFGFSAKHTLSLAQALYEKHKVLTYPRTDSRALPEDYLGDGARRRSTMLGADEAVRARIAFARKIRQQRLGASRTSASSTTRRSRITSRSFRPRSRRSI